jgi:hypothetical protein
MTIDEKKVTMVLEQDKVTPNAIRFAEVAAPGNSNPKNMYFQKSEIEKLGNPKKLNVTVTVG